MKESRDYPLWADKPLEDPKRDALNYADFARQLAQLVQRMPSEGLVVAIRGDWGLGKSTVLNFVEYYLKQPAKGNRPIVVRFNPWWFGGRKDLTLQFFDSLQGGLTEAGAATEELRKSLADLASLVSRLPVPYLKEASEVAAMLLRPERKDVVKLKQEIADNLRRQRGRVVIIIDDVDRLDEEEIRLLFSAIKGVADFPNVCYFLAFDWQVVVKTLTGMQGEDGEDYLEKIVQLPTAVPRPARTALHAFCREKIQPVFKDARPELQETDTRSYNLEAAVLSFIDTPRDALRLANSVAAFYEHVRDEAIVSDYLAACALNVFCPLAFDLAARCPERFEATRPVEGRVKTELIAFHSHWLQSVREKDGERLVKLLSEMYPHLQSVFEEIEHGRS